jgi:hypothetical protein
MSGGWGAAAACRSDRKARQAAVYFGGKARIIDFALSNA